MERSNPFEEEDGDKELSMREQSFAREVMRLEVNNLNIVDLYMSSIPDLSVNTETEALLKRRRWLACTRIDMPLNSIPISKEEVVQYVGSRLKGREPFFYYYKKGGYLEGHYKIESANDEAQLQVDNFALSVALAIGALPTAVRSATLTAYDMGDLEDIMSEDRRREPYRGDQS